MCRDFVRREAVDDQSHGWYMGSGRRDPFEVNGSNQGETSGRPWGTRPESQVNVGFAGVS